MLDIDGHEVQPDLYGAGTRFSCSYIRIYWSRVSCRISPDIDIVWPGYLKLDQDINMT